MSWSERAIRRPIATAMVFVALTVLGAMSYTRLQVDLFPELDFPSISVVTTYPGVSPEEIETLITRPIEAAVARVEGIDRIESFSAEGRSRVALRFTWGMGLDEAMNEVRAAVERVRSTLPDEANAPVVYRFNLTNLPVASMAIESDLEEVRLGASRTTSSGPTSSASRESRAWTSAARETARSAWSSTPSASPRSSSRRAT